MNTKELIAAEIAKVVPELEQENIQNLLEIPKNADMGDLAFPAFSLAKVLRKAPQMIAADIAEKIDASNFEKVEAVGPYINIFLDKSKISADVLGQVIAQGSHYADQNIGNGRNIAFDMSSPNIAKPFSIGHLRSTVIADALANIVAKQGYKPVRINHLGDWGKQFGMLIVAYKKWGSREAVEEKGIQELMDIYVKFHEEAEKDDSLNDEARAWFLKMEQGDQEALEIWQWFRDISLKEFMRVYDILGMEFDSFAGESFYRDKTADVVKRLTDDGLLKESQGAMIVPLDEYDMPPCIVAKKDGSSIYATRDLAAILYRKETYNFERCLYVTGLEQKLHFAQVFKVIELMGNDYAKNLIHIPYGLVSLKSGKISSRKGNVIFAEDLLRESINKTTSIIEEKNPDIPDKEEVAKQVGIGAIIFNDLYNQRIKDVIFDWEKLLNFDGETGPYVQYTYARASSVLRKIGDVPSTIDYNLLTDEASIGLLKEIERYPQIIKDAADRYEPSVIARYSIDLAHAFNKFYHECQINVEDETTKYTRTNVVKIVRYIIKDALSLLGIQCPEQM